MRILSFSAITAIMLGFTLAGPASTAAQSNDFTSPHKAVLGYLDPQTGTFKPLTRIAPDAVTTPATTGTIVLNLTVTLKTALPKGGSIVCGAVVVAESMNLSVGTVSEWSEIANSAATVSGSKATCTVDVPYSWVVPSPSSLVKNTISGSYTVEMINASGVSVGLVRSTEGDFLSGSIPASGATSTYTLTPVI